MPETIDNVNDEIKNKFISSLEKVSEKQYDVADLKEHDENRSNIVFLCFCGVIGLLIVASVIYIALSDPFYHRRSGMVAEFFMTLGIQILVLAEILKSVRKDDSIYTHIMASIASSFVLGVVMVVMRIFLVPDKPMIWAVFPVLAKFGHLNTVPQWLLIGCFILPVIIQFLILLLFYKQDKLSLVGPFFVSTFVANSIIAFIMLSPLIGGV
jgi:hypothetical protein